MNMVHAIAGESTRPCDKDSQKISWREFFEAQFPENTADCVRRLTKTTIRAAQLMLDRDQGPGRYAMQNLLRSRLGPAVLDFIAGDVDWRAEERRLLDLAAIEQELEQLKLKRRALTGGQ